MVCLTQGDLDIAGYYTKDKQLWDEFSAVSGASMCTCTKCECDVSGKLQSYREEQRLIQFLMGLNNSYTAVRGNILMMNRFSLYESSLFSSCSRIKAETSEN